MQKRFLLSEAESMLLAATLIWGGTFPVIKAGLAFASPLYLTAVRFSAAFLIFWIIWIIYRKRKAEWRGLIYGTGLGAVMFISYYLQAEGLRYTTASRSAFITQMLILFTPLFEYLLYRVLPDRLTVYSIFIVIAGLLVFSGPEAGGLNTGDLLTMLCAVTFALHIVMLSHVSSKAGLWELLMAQTASTAVLGWITFYLTGETADFRITDTGFILAVFYLSFIATNAAVYIQTRWQRKAGSVRASVIYSMEPVFAAVLASVMLQESMNFPEIAGALIMIAGILLKPLITLYKDKGL